MTEKGSADPTANSRHDEARSASEDRRRQHLLWYGAAVLTVLLVIGVVQLVS
jgi:hypothetical protein